MVMLNHTGEEVNAKIVYYGPGLSGKTTNLDTIHRKMPAGAKGKMVSMKTRTDRTLFFDFLPIEFGEIAGYPTRFLMYTVPGQVYYNATRKLVLGGVDAVVFVADSSKAKLQENLESLSNLEDNLNEHGLSLDNIPWVIQYNKRDLPDAMPIPELEQQLNLLGVPAIEATAHTGDGVYETFECIASLLYEDLRRRLEGGEVVSRMDVGSDPAVPAASAPSLDETQPLESFDNAIENALREVDSSNPANTSRVQAAGSPASQDRAQPAASTRETPDSAPAPADGPMFSRDGDGEMDSELGRTLDFDDSDGEEASDNGENTEFITDPMGSRTGSATGSTSGKANSTQPKTQLPPRFTSNADLSSERELDTGPDTGPDEYVETPAASEPVVDLVVEPIASEKVEPVKAEPERVEPKPPVPPPGKASPVTETAVKTAPKPAPAPAQPEPTTPPSPARKEVAPVEITVPVVLTRSQVRRDIPVRLLLKIKVVDD